MTGQVKEEVLTRFGELGVRVSEGCVRFEPRLLRAREFTAGQHSFRYLDVDGEWQELTAPRQSLVFTWCQVPIVYTLSDGGRDAGTATLEDGTTLPLPDLSLSSAHSAAIFERSGLIRRVDVSILRGGLFTEQDHE